MSDPLRLVIGAQERACLTIAPLCRPYAESAEPWDRDSVLVTAELRCNGLQGSCEGELRAEDFVLFREGLQQLYSRLEGEAALMPRDPWLAVRIRALGLGHFAVSCEMREGPGFANCLAVRLDFDQTEIPRMLQALDGIVAAYPVTEGSSC